MNQADAMLEELTVRGRERSPDALSILDRPAITPRIAKMRYSHEAMIDVMLAHPEYSQNKLAELFDRTAPWISIVVNSDAFKALYAQRRSEVLDPELVATIKERFEALTVKSLQVLQEKLCKPADQVPDQLALRAAELGAKSLGLGGHAPTPAAPSGDRLTILAERLRAFIKPNGQGAIDVEVRTISQG